MIGENMYTKHNIKELRKIAKEHGLKNINGYRKDDLVDFLIKKDEETAPKQVKAVDNNTMELKSSLLLEKVTREIIFANPNCDIDIFKLEKILKEIISEKIKSDEKVSQLSNEVMQLKNNSNVTEINENKSDSKFEKIKMYETRIFELENKLQNTEKELTGIKNKFASSVMNNSEGSRSSNSSSDEYELKLTIKKLEKKNDELVVLFNSFQNEYFNAKKQIDVLESRLSGRTENYYQNKSINLELSNIKKENENLKINLEENEKLVKSLNNKVENLNKDLKLVESNSKTSSELLQINANLNNEKQDLIKNQIRYLNEKNELEKENVHLKKNANFNTSSLEVSSLTQKLNSANEEIKKLSQKIKSFEQNNNSVSVERLEYNYKYLQKKYLKSREENDNLKVLQGKVRRELDELKLSKDESQIEKLYKSANAELESLTDKYNQVYSEKIKLSIEVSEMKATIYNFRNLNKD